MCFKGIERGKGIKIMIHLVCNPLSGNACYSRSMLSYILLYANDFQSIFNDLCHQDNNEVLFPDILMDEFCQEPCQNVVNESLNCENQTTSSSE